MVIKNKKRIIFLGILLLIMSAGFVMAEEINQTTYYTSKTANIEITSLKYEPYPVEPGEYFELWIKVENKGSNEARNATCILQEAYPFSLDENNAEKNIGKLTQGSTFTVKYKVRVDENAVEGENELKIKCTDYPLNNAWLITKIPVKIQTRYAVLNIKKIETEPKAIAPGEKAEIKILLENTADSSMKDINIKLNLSDAPIASFEEVPEKKIRRINALNTSILVFSIIALPEVEGGIYKVPLEITYTDELGKEYVGSNLITVEIKAPSDIYAVIDSTTMHKRKKTGDVAVKIVNKGLTDLKFMDINLQPSRYYKIISSRQVYVGDLDSDDYETIEFRMTVKRRQVILPLELSYRDTSNNLHSEKINVTFQLFSANEIGMEESKTGLVIFIIAVLFIIFIIYRNWKRKNKEKNCLDFIMLVPKKIAERIKSRKIVKSGKK